MKEEENEREREINWKRLKKGRKEFELIIREKSESERFKREKTFAYSPTPIYNSLNHIVG